MAIATKRPAGLSDQQLVEVLELVKGADSVELKLAEMKTAGPRTGGRSRSARTDRIARCHRCDRICVICVICG